MQEALMYFNFYENRWICFLIVLFVFVSIVYIFLFDQKKYIYSNFFYLVVPSIIIVITMSLLNWVYINSSCPRYITHSIILLFVFVSVIISKFCMLIITRYHILSNLTSKIKNIKYLFTLLLLIIFLIKPFGFSFEIKSIPNQIIKKHDIPIDEINKSNSIAISGNYWKVWPAVWSINAINNNKNFYGITNRSSDAINDWKNIVYRNGLICYYATDENDTKYYLSEFFKDVKYKYSIESDKVKLIKLIK
ncbi:MAG: hypothetical protein HQK77_12380 [Desulfobacterales bacterium]|nr:hypothetical protein [Desulfobacterales bacterium]